MRDLLMAVLMAAYPASLAAQSCEPGGAVMAGLTQGPVAVTMKAGEQLKGTLICVDRDVVVLGDGERIHNLPLADITRIVKPRDPLWNGIAIGAAVGLVAGALTYGEAAYSPGGRDAAYVMAPMGVYALVGAVVDALHGSSWTIYSAEEAAGNAPMLGFRVRF